MKEFHFTVQTDLKALSERLFFVSRVVFKKYVFREYFFPKEC